MVTTKEGNEMSEDNKPTTAITRRESTGLGMPIHSLTDVQAVGKWLAQSSMFGINSDAQGAVVVLACRQSGMNLMEFRETYHIIHSTPSMRADAMLARFVEMGGTYELKARTAEEARAVFEFRGCKGEFCLTWDDAQKEPFIYKQEKGTTENDIVAKLAAGVKPEIKAKYSTPRARMQMLWARVVSDGVRTVCPQANKGTYTPEEVDDYAPPSQHNDGPLSKEEVARRADAAKPVVIESTVMQGAAFCPVPGPHYGAPWASLDTGMLEAVDIVTAEEFPEITADHHSEIKAELNKRSEQK